MLNRLLANVGFREQLMARMAELLRGPLSDEAVLARLEEFLAVIDGDMHYNCVRWAVRKTYEQWLGEVDLLRQGAGIGIRGRADRFLRQFVSYVHPEESLVRRYFGEEYLS
jgi:hypothetical protein